MIPLNPDHLPLTAHGRVAARLRDLILSNEWAAGDHLPPENDLSKQLGVSRLTLRAGVAMLVNDGLLTVAQGYGTTVLNWRRSGAMRLLDPLLMLHLGRKSGQDGMHQVLWLRRTLYRNLPELLCRRDVTHEAPQMAVWDVRALFRYPEEVRAVEALQAEEHVLVGFAEASRNTPVALLANALLRGLGAVARNSSAHVETKDLTDQLHALATALAERKRPQAEKLFDQFCRAREPQYLALIAGRHKLKATE